ncbi:hypothetical protein P3T21_007551 [Paraburkholderia sp. GAS334]
MTLTFKPAACVVTTVRSMWTGRGTGSDRFFSSP